MCQDDHHRRWTRHHRPSLFLSSSLFFSSFALSFSLPFSFSFSVSFSTLAPSSVFVVFFYPISTSISFFPLPFSSPCRSMFWHLTFSFLRLRRRRVVRSSMLHLPLANISSSPTRADGRTTFVPLFPLFSPFPLQLSPPSLVVVTPPPRSLFSLFSSSSPPSSSSSSSSTCSTPLHSLAIVAYVAADNDPLPFGPFEVSEADHVEMRRVHDLETAKCDADRFKHCPAHLAY